MTLSTMYYISQMPDPITHSGQTLPELVRDVVHQPDAASILRPLRPQHRRVVLAYIEQCGRDYASIGRKAGYKGKRPEKQISDVVRSPEIARAISALQKLVDDASILDVVERRKILSELATGRRKRVKRTRGTSASGEYVDLVEEADPDPVSAIGELNRMDGAYPPAKLQVESVTFNLDLTGASRGQTPAIDVPADSQSADDDAKPEENQ